LLSRQCTQYSLSIKYGRTTEGKVGHGQVAMIKLIPVFRPEKNSYSLSSIFLTQKRRNMFFFYVCLLVLSMNLI